MGSWSRCCANGLRCLLLGVGLSCAPSLLAQAADIAYQIKASYIYNFLQFVRFPETALRGEGTLNVCVLGEDRFGSALDAIDGSTTPQGRVKVLRLGHYTGASDLGRCNVLYLIDSERQGTDAILAKVDEAQVLTIGEFSPFIRHGGLIELFEQNDTIRFRINEKLLSKTDFKIDAQLIQLGVK
ncbi:YfiR family protein [Pseudomonas sp.]|uniref:YfiR family protein n=1 Tax=Pseudomonas sp. TaxID=306 RepID=UPI0035664BDC